MDTITVALADDHNLVRNAIGKLIDSYGDYKVILQANNGQELISGMQSGKVPEIILLDINMPFQDGFSTCQIIRDNFPQSRVLALSMYDKEYAIIRMLRAGARGYLLKDIDPGELRTALDTLMKTGYYYSGMVSGRLIHAINKMDDTAETIQIISRIQPNEQELLKLISTELTYKEIADQLNINPRTVDSQREILFEKLKVKSRVGLVIQAIRLGLIHID